MSDDPVFWSEYRRKIYFIQMGRNGPVKIGHTRNPRRRFDALQQANPEKLRLLAVLPMEQFGHEAQIHRRFKVDHIRGEWFRPSHRMDWFLRRRLFRWTCGVLSYPGETDAAR